MVVSEDGRDKVPSSGVLRLFLTPDDLLQVLELVELLIDDLDGEGTQFLDADDGVGLSITSLRSLGLEINVDLSRAQDDPLHLIGLDIIVRNDGQEVSSRLKIFEARDGLWMSQQDLGRQDDEWLSKVSQHLSSQDVEVVGRSGNVDDAHVDVLVGRIHGIDSVKICQR